MKDITPNVLKTLFVPIPENENIQFRSCQIFGTMGSGKTSLYRFIGKKAVEHYGEDNVNPILSTDMDALLEGINSQAVQVLFLDDAGLETQSVAETLVAKFTFIRHIFEEKRQAIGKKNGILLILFAVQDYFLLAKKLRSTLHVEIFKHAPTNKSDIGKIKEFLGELAIKVLIRISKKIFEEHRYEWLSTCIAKTISGRVGYFYYDFIPREDSILIEVEAKEKTPVSFSISDGDYNFFELKEFVNNDIIVEALYNWENIRKKIKLSTKLLRQKHIDAFIKYMRGDNWETIADYYNVASTSLTNSYKARGWAAIVRTEILGHLVEYQLTQSGEYYAGYKRIAGNARIDLLSPDKNKAIEVKVRQQRETPTSKMLSTEMLKLLEEDFHCELCYCIIRSNNAIFKVFKITTNLTNPKQLYDPNTPGPKKKKVPLVQEKSSNNTKKKKKGSQEQQENKKELKKGKGGVIKPKDEVKGRQYLIPALEKMKADPNFNKLTQKEKYSMHERLMKEMAEEKEDVSNDH